MQWTESETDHSLLTFAEYKKIVGAMPVSTVVWLHGGHEDNFALSILVIRPSILVLVYIFIGNSS
jgi:hypothetical protein